MSRHSKNNTANPVFTYYERRLLKYGTVSERLSKDSLKDYDSCSLCMNPAQDPLCCESGHIFCKECIYEYLLTQKKEIAKETEFYEEQERRIQAQKDLEEQKKKEKEIEKFDKSVFGIVQQTTESEKTKEIAPKDSKNEKEDDDESKKKPSLPFWVPGVIKESEPSLLKKPSKDIKCPDGKQPHNIKLKKLIKLNFKPNKSKSESTAFRNRFECWVCCKTLIKGTKTIALAKCGHVCCQACFDKIKSSSVCFACGEKFREKDVIKIESGGTGYAANSGENLIAKKSHLVLGFSCNVLCS